jgi:protein-S-isoprenylcysteine O-methyltransferase Ste14
VLESSVPLTPPPRSGSFREFIFHHRLQVGLAAVAFAGLIVHPRNIFGPWAVSGHIACVLLVVTGLALRAWAGGSAGRHTRKATIEAPQLATGGPFAYVRNPIYLASIILGLGMVGLLGDPWMFALYVAVFVFLYGAIVPAEEQFLRREFGEQYARYCAHVPRLWPRFRRWSGAQAAHFDRYVVLGEVRLGLVLVGIYVFLRGCAWLRGW